MLSEEKLNFLTKIAKGLAGHFGDNCEIVIHQINGNNIDNSIVSIENGHVSSRHLGDGPSQVVLEALKKPQDLKDHINYLTRTHNGRILKFSTIYLKDSSENLEGTLAINYDITGLVAAESTIKSFMSIDEQDKKLPDSDYIPQNINELLNDLIQESVNLVGKTVPLMTKDDKIKCIQFLNSKDAFLVTKSGDKIANFFNISKYTLYSYIDAK